MSTDRPHPDAELLARLRAAMDWWEAEARTVHPTSSVTGGGAIEELEARLAALHDRPYAVAVPSATLGLRLALQAVGVRPGDEVLVPGIDWTATAEAVTALGAVPVPVPVGELDLLVDPLEAARLRTRRTTAVVLCHLHGLPGDPDALREATGLPVVEDVAAALGSTRDGVLAGSRGDVAVVSLGPGKVVDAGEGGVLLTSRRDVRDRALGLSAHPVRLALEGVPRSDRSLSLRAHPVAAILALHLLSGFDPARAREAWTSAARALEHDPRVARVLGSPGQHSAGRSVAVGVAPRSTGGAATWAPPSGATALRADGGALLATTRLVPVPG